VIEERDIQDRVADLFFGDVPMGVLAVDAELRVMWSNDSTAWFVGLTAADLQGRFVYEFIHPDDLQMIAGSLGMRAAGRPSLATIFRSINTSGEVRHVEGTVMAHDGESDDLKFVIILRDPTPTLRIDDFIDSILHSDIRSGLKNLMAIAEAEKFQVSIHWNATATGFADVISSGPDVESLARHAQVEPVIRATLGGSTTCSLLADLGVESKGGRQSFYMYPIGSGADLGVLVGWFPHGTDLGPASHMFFKRTAKLGTLALTRYGIDTRLRHAATTDQLTGLGNRAALNARIEAALTQHEGCTLLLLDLDGFKSINDEFGHHRGDLVLVEVAHRLRSLCESSSVTAAVGGSAFAGRLGGDEFAIVIDGACEPDPLSEFVAAVRESLTRPIRDQDSGGVNHFSIGVSIGKATANDATDVGGILAAADAAMYAEKRSRVSLISQRSLVVEVSES
jgi:diguanylate cyclase (GGDEF)-like protein/PAS domain S-box-containing protein